MLYPLSYGRQHLHCTRCYRQSNGGSAGVGNDVGKGSWRLQNGRTAVRPYNAILLIFSPLRVARSVAGLSRMLKPQDMQVMAGRRQRRPVAKRALNIFCPLQQAVRFLDLLKLQQDSR